jgi:NADH-quinone oxidoreductase subunit J
LTAAQVVFLIATAITLASAVMVVTLRRMMQSALALILALMGVAMIFAILGSGFFAVTQVVVYIGAIAILIIFAVMLTQNSMNANQSQLNPGAMYGLLGVAVMLAGLVFVFSAWSSFKTLPAELPAGSGDVATLGLLFTDPQGFALPFEAVSILLVAALVGAIFIARDKRKDE